jgi:hypothetical protein
VGCSSHEPHQVGLTSLVGQLFVGCGVTNQWACTWDVGSIPSPTEPDGGRWIQVAAVALRLDLLNPALNLVQVVAHVLPYSAI